MRGARLSCPLWILLALSLLPAACTAGPDIVSEPLPPDDFRIDWIFTHEEDAEDPGWRFGRVPLGGRELEFALFRPGGDWSDLNRLTLSIDRDGDGLFGNDRIAGEGYGADERFDVGTGDPAPALPTATLDGEPLSLADFRGREVLLYFWASGWGECRRGISEISERTRADGFPDVLGICLDADPQTGRDFLREAGDPFRSAWEAGGWGAPVGKRYGISCLPSAVLVGPDEVILRRRVGLHEFD
jgi:hypothetical protein